MVLMGTRTEWLRDVAAGLAAATDLWQPRMRDYPDHPWFTTLILSETYDAWLIGWSPGQGVALHDHGESAGALFVVEGELLETVVDVDAHLDRRTLVRGAVADFGPGEVHAVANCGHRAATSIHVYTPALTTMSFFGASGRALHRTHVEHVHDDVVVAR